MSTTKRLADKQLITPPKWLAESVQYETIMGSFAYGVSSDTSDMDLYGFCIPPKYVIFPHTAGYIPGFGSQPKGFEQYQKHHVFVQDDLGGKGRSHDIVIYSIVKYFDKCMECNPNMIDSLFTHTSAVQHITEVGQMVRDNRHLFLHKGVWDKFRGYAYSQLKKMQSKTPVGKRVDTVEKFGYDVKFAYHIVRLVGECEQLLAHGDLDLMKDRERLKAIRNGDWRVEDVEQWFYDKEKRLEQLLVTTDLPEKPREDEIKDLLIRCLKRHYGKLDDAIENLDELAIALRGIDEIINTVRKRIS